ncbi:Glycerophosphoryl diester phosphodiesterase family protein [Dyadobacter soli]|uniref:Glycerophosphoryl diester phosphodiesterase family protein n=1 Tax=Dyadobacter soli TaxID=659014 RepID=A0A1G7GH63_9BACT|nr:glycerophosphodiester phosphodiesterase family protein [Dyadobacter soli]SDE87359.1 Glycerophosphoryl diester phosphodiesterase family protein [Dyadobacter soli]
MLTLPINKVNLSGLIFRLMCFSAIILFAGNSPAFAKDKPRLIGHRGGVIDSTHTENSLAGLKAAYKRGYYMAEIDIRLTKDGQLIILHDPTLKAYYNVNKAARELTWEEIRGLKSDRDGSSPVLLEDALKYCKGRLQVMLDTKIAGDDPVNFKKIEDLLRKYNLLENAFVIGSNEIRNYFNGKSKTGYSINALKQLKTQNQFVADRYFLFTHGNEIKEEDVKWAQANHVMVVPSINKYHYRDIPFMDGAKRDIENLKKWGVVYYQIDSEFDRWLVK